MNKLIIDIVTSSINVWSARESKIPLQH